MIFYHLTLVTCIAASAMPAFASPNLKGGRQSKEIESERKLQEKDIKTNIFSSNVQTHDFFYPEDMPSPPQLFIEGIGPRLENLQKYETPIQIWQTNRLDQVMWNCIAAYHPTALDALTKERPPVKMPSVYHTSKARALCMIHAVNKIVPEVIPISAPVISTWLSDLGLNSTIMGNSEAQNMVLEQGDISPRAIGSYVASKTIEDMQQDGWNYKGHTGSNGEECTANCRPFSDTTGYVPKNDPWTIKDPKSWQPLIESDELGFFHAQEHVTPHIGLTAKPVVLTRDEVNARELPAPKYDLTEEAENSIANVAETAGDLYRQTMVNFMNNKLNIFFGIFMRLREKYNLSLEAQVFFNYGYTSTELDVVILAWKEKVRHSLIRPTSVVQALGDMEVESFAGTHLAKDWVPFIRVMPHAEYPSGSGCLCLGAAQYIDAFLNDAYNDDSIRTTWNFEDFGEVVFGNMTEFYNTCGDSRIWGGMHFRASVPDAYQLCDGVGTRGYADHMVSLLGKGSYAELSSSVPRDVTLP